ncbi:MAG: hypothetical protein KAS36_11945, partial [Anaerolineales bacterium]|nr:hypothetical protein [Anaerolineales bacterium]
YYTAWITFPGPILLIFLVSMISQHSLSNTPKHPRSNAPQYPRSNAPALEWSRQPDGLVELPG